MRRAQWSERTGRKIGRKHGGDVSADDQAGLRNEIASPVGYRKIESDYVLSKGDGLGGRRHFAEEGEG